MQFGTRAALLKKPQQRIAEMQTMPPPVGGLNDRDSLMAMGPNDAIRLENFICRPYGLVMRNGYTEFATGLPPYPVDTLMTYIPAAAVPVQFDQQQNDSYAAFSFDPTRADPSYKLSVMPGSAMFAACNGEVFDVTYGGTGPWTADPVIQGSYFSWCNFTNEAGSFLLACDIDGGYYIFDGTAWVKPQMGTNPGEIDGVDPGTFNFVFVWKSRVWFVQQATGLAWYLPTNQITGKVSPWNFGSQFRHGGHLQVMANWTIDAGLGVDDHLVAFGSEGDIVVYTGSDPDNAPDTFQLKGVWYCGPLPATPRCVDQYGGDLLVLSSSGLAKMTDIVRFGDTQRATAYQTTKINNALSRFIRAYHDLPAWQIIRLPGLSLNAFAIPYEANRRPTMLVQDENTQGWSVLYDHPCSSLANFSGNFYAGTEDGRIVNAFDGTVDNLKLGETSYSFISGRITPAYSQLDKPGLQKIMGQLRLSMLGVAAPTIKVTPLVNYYLEQQSYAPVLPDLTTRFGKWDQSLWDAQNARWAGGGTPLIVWIGVAAQGFAVTPQIDFTAYGGLTLNQYDWLYTTGGPL